MFLAFFAAARLKVSLRLIFKANDKMVHFKWSCQSAENDAVGEIITYFFSSGWEGGD